MKEDFNKLIEKAVQLELLVAKLYIKFHALFPPDAGFWWTLAIEEKNHASLLKTLQELNETHLEIPPEFYPEGSEVLEESLQQIAEAIRVIETNPDRKLALQLAYDIENAAGELHYDSFAKTASRTPVAKVFRTLNGSDIDHARRIREYMNRLNMS
jgi:hypothetical protein